MTENISPLNASEFDALLDLAFLELDFELPKNHLVLEGSSRAVLNYSSIGKMGFIRDLFSRLSLNSVLFSLSALLAISIYFIFCNSKAPLVNVHKASLPVTEKGEIKQDEVLNTTETNTNRTEEKKQVASPTRLLQAATDTSGIVKPTVAKEEAFIPVYHFPAPGSFFPPMKDTLTYLPLTASEMKEINRSLVKVKGNLYASEVEISNRWYMDFLTSLKQAQRKDLLEIAQIDTLKWRDKESYNEPYVTWYHKHPAYQEYPVVNISYHAALLYCAWLTTQYNSNPKRKFDKVQFRLPTEQEWMTAARAGDSTAVYPWEGIYLRNKKGMLMCNFKRDDSDQMGVAGALSDNADVTAPAKAYWPNKWGLYCMSGNVAEMVAEKGIVKGGSWNKGEEYLKIEARYPYDGNPQNFIGFRYFMEVIIF